MINIANTKKRMLDLCHGAHAHWIFDYKEFEINVKGIMLLQCCNCVALFTYTCILYIHELSAKPYKRHLSVGQAGWIKNIFSKMMSKISALSISNSSRYILDVTYFKGYSDVCVSVRHLWF